MGRISLNEAMKYSDFVPVDPRVYTIQSFFNLPIDHLLAAGAVDVYFNTQTKELNPVFERKTTIPKSGVRHGT